MEGTPLRIKTVEQIKKYASINGGQDFFILLKYGLRSSKHICYFDDTKRFHILNEIDSSRCCCGAKMLNDPKRSFIAEAMQKGCFFKYPW